MGGPSEFDVKSAQGHDAARKAEWYATGGYCEWIEEEGRKKNEAIAIGLFGLYGRRDSSVNIEGN